MKIKFFLIALLFSFAFTQTTDMVLQERIESIFSSIQQFEGITVSVNNGVATLTGTAANVQVKNDADALLNNLSDVIYVINNLDLEASVTKSLNPALTKLSEYLNNTIALLPLIAIALLVVVIFWVLAFWISSWTFLYKRFNKNYLLKNFARQLVRVAIFLLGLVIALDIVGATPFVAAILGTAGVAGLAIGFAFRDIIENYLAGILISLQQPFDRNDAIRLASHEGKVVRLTTRELVLLTFDGNHVRIPNATVFKSEIYNFTRNPLRRFDFLVGVDVEEDLEHVQSLGVATLDAMNGITEDPAPFALIKELGDFNVVISFYAWVNQKEANFGKVKSQAIRLVKEAFDEAGVLMPEPITNVRLKQIAANEALTQEENNSKAKPSPNSKRHASKTLAEAKNVDVSVDEQLDQQIKEEQESSTEANLLDN